MQKSSTKDSHFFNFIDKNKKGISWQISQLFPLVAIIFSSCQVETVGLADTRTNTDKRRHTTSSSNKFKKRQKNERSWGLLWLYWRGFPSINSPSPQVCLSRTGKQRAPQKLQSAFEKNSGKSAQFCSDKTTQNMRIRRKYFIIIFA